MSNAVIIAQQGSNNTTFRNRIINGAMVIDQRNAGASVTLAATNTYTLDRWQGVATQASKFSIQQNAASVTRPAGYTYYLGATSLSAYSVLSGDYFLTRQMVEGFNFADMAWGTANAKTVTLSFQVYSSLTGTFGGALNNGAADRSYPFTYTISSANTWTQISVTIAGDTSGTWLTTNGIGVHVHFGLGVGTTYSGTAGAWAGATYFSATGATSVVGTNGATFYITGVQLEAGSTASPFENRQYGTELQLCQRYCPVYDFVASGDGYSGAGANATLSDYRIPFPVPVRAAATGITTSGSFSVSNLGAGSSGATLAYQTSGTLTIGIRVTTTAGSPTLSQGVGTQLYTTTTAKIIVTGCEL